MPRFRKTRTGDWVATRLTTPLALAALAFALPTALLLEGNGGKGKDDKKDDDKKDDDKKKDDELDGLTDEEIKALGDKGKAAIRRERKARKDAERERDDERRRREAAESKANNAKDDDDKKNTKDDAIDPAELRREMRVENARERAADKAEIVARDAGVPKEKMRRFLKIVDLDDAVDDDGNIDIEAIEDAIDDALEDVPEFKADDDGHDDDDDDTSTRDRTRDRDDDTDRTRRRRRDPAHQGPRRRTTEPLDDRVKSRKERIKQKTGLS